MSEMAARTSIGGLGSGGVRIEPLFFSADAPGEHGRTQHEQGVADDRAHDRRLDHRVEPGTQRGEGDDQLGGVAERRVEEPPDAFPGFLGELLGGPAHPARQGQDREGRSGEDQQMPLRCQMFKGDRDGNENQKLTHDRFSLIGRRADAASTSSRVCVSSRRPPTVSAGPARPAAGCARSVQRPPLPNPSLGQIRVLPCRPPPPGSGAG